MPVIKLISDILCFILYWYDNRYDYQIVIPVILLVFFVFSIAWYDNREDNRYDFPRLSYQLSYLLSFFVLFCSYNQFFCFSNSNSFLSYFTLSHFEQIKTASIDTSCSSFYSANKTSLLLYIHTRIYVQKC